MIPLILTLVAHAPLVPATQELNAPPANVRQAPPSAVAAEDLSNRAQGPMLGVQMVPVDDAVAAQLPDHLGAAVMLTRVYPDSGAERAGLLLHDVIYAVDGNSEVSVEGLIAAIRAKEVGDALQLDVARKGRQFRLSATLGERKAVLPSIGGALGTNQNAHLEALHNAMRAYPRYGASPDGNMMIQREEHGTWQPMPGAENDKTLMKYYGRRGGVVGRQPQRLDPRHLPEELTQVLGPEESQRLKERLAPWAERGSHAPPDSRERLEARVADLESKIDSLIELVQQLAGDRR